MRAMTLVMLGSAAAWGVALAAPTGDDLPANAGRDDTFVRGVALGLFATDPSWDYGPLVDEIAERGATDVLVVVNTYQSNRFAIDIGARAERSPSVGTVARTLRQVRNAGMRAALMPVVRLEARAPHEWRGAITPADGLDAWFAAYARFVLPLARVAAAEGAQRFVVASELSSLERYDTEWRRLIREIRAAFPGRLTYSANWDHAGEVPFWDALDEVGITGYFPVSKGDGLSAASLSRAWQSPLAEIQALAERIGKRVLITEIGYASRRGAGARPWDDSGAAEVDLRLQQRLYRGFCDAFAGSRSVSGFYAWNWFGFGGPRDAGFTPRGKPAASELSACFARDWGAPVLVGNQP
jgi:hypothetical protein